MKFHQLRATIPWKLPLGLRSSPSSAADFSSWASFLRWPRMGYKAHGTTVKPTRYCWQLDNYCWLLIWSMVTTPPESNMGPHLSLRCAHSWSLFVANFMSSRTGATCFYWCVFSWQILRLFILPTSDEAHRGSGFVWLRTCGGTRSNLRGHDYLPQVDRCVPFNCVPKNPGSSCEPSRLEPSSCD